MSGKIKGKDLSYDKALPPFLQRLHAQKAGSGDADRHERAIARPRKANVMDDDDGPTVVDEDGEMLSRDAVEEMTRPAADVPVELDQPTAVLGAEAHNTASKNTNQKITTGAAQKKRKAVVVIGDDEATAEKEKESMKNRKVAKPSKKPKTIKLAFDQDDGD